MSAHRLHFGFRGATLINSGAHGAGVMVVQVTDQQRTKVDGLHLGPERLETEALPDEGFANKTSAAVPFDFAIAAHLPLHPANWIIQSAVVRWHGFCAFPIPVLRHFLPQRFMWAEAVVTLDPARGAMLLTLPSLCGRAGGFSFEDAVHLLVRPIFFRMPGADELHSDPQRRPPNTQAGQARRPGRGERTAIVSADHLRQAVTFEKLGEDSLGRLPTLIGQKADDHRGGRGLPILTQQTRLDFFRSPNGGGGGHLQ